MPDTPPPLPVAGPADARALSQELARMAPPHAPLFWRTLAFLVDASLFGLLGYFILTRFLLPEYLPEALSASQKWLSGITAGYLEILERSADGRTAPEALTAELERWAETLHTAPEALHELGSYCASAMTVIYWIGFSLSEILTGGASLGKRMFRLRVAAFPHAEKPGVFDSIVRNGWKAMGVATLNPLALLFAIVDAHWPLFNPLRRSLHDYLARTVVLDARYDPPETPKPETVGDDDAGE